jgi:TfoX/Sxy family transcriptional regulator of competence genes
MPFSQALADRVRDAVARESAVTDKRMFGGLAFLHRGNLLVGVHGDSLIARLGAEEAAIALKEADVRPFDLTGVAMKGWVFIDADGIDSDASLRAWIERALRFVRTLPPKAAKTRDRKSK